MPLKKCHCHLSMSLHCEHTQSSSEEMVASLSHTHTNTLTEESQHEDAIVPYPQLVSIIKVIPGYKVIILPTDTAKDTNRLNHATVRTIITGSHVRVCIMYLIPLKPTNESLQQCLWPWPCRLFQFCRVLSVGMRTTEFSTT